MSLLAFRTAAMKTTYSDSGACMSDKELFRISDSRAAFEVGNIFFVKIHEGKLLLRRAGLASMVEIIVR